MVLLKMMARVRHSIANLNARGSTTILQAKTDMFVIVLQNFQNHQNTYACRYKPNFRIIGTKNMLLLPIFQLLRF